MTSLPDWLVERAALDEVAPASRDRLERADPRELAGRVAALREDNAAEQPVLLTTREDNPNGSNVRFLVDGATPGDLSSYERAIYLFDGNDPDAVDVARDQWKEAQGESFQTIYWQQDADGRWQKKA